MNDFTHTQARAGSMDMSVDAGLRAFMLGVYNKLALGLVVSGLLAIATSQVAPIRDLLFTVQATPQGMMVGLTMLGMIVQFSPIVLLFGSMFFMRNPSASGASLLYWAVVAAIGASLGLVFLIYTSTSVATTFFVTAAAFGGLSLFGYTTKRDLSAIGSFLVMGVIGLIIAMVVNMFLQSSALMYAISAAGVLIFSGLIAWDTQRLKATYYALGGNEAGMAVATSFGALSLYINFINLFQFLLMFLGQRE
ncbi:Bax inhibitor-1/YccA family protein [Hyphobacterium marinum]|uniref:Bax inhibitor-1/YccA family protein n=1 Tax=Hyphobacterium marinum TaxID=3116574 RepID=A0ABU7LVH3_9PROT|nr:Bax inhibitor-1/YccA family protein [Hyphobacterium sp. Y6023]MEE2565553.1 Bax inhibitor-1/YccA family protein [Hyphobacterium sp. Y6023]